MNNHQFVFSLRIIAKANKDEFKHYVQLAIKSYRDGVYKNAATAARAHGIWPSTLSRRLNGKTQSRARAHEHQKYLTTPQEYALTRYVLYLIDRGYPPSVKTIERMAYNIKIAAHIRQELPGVAVAPGVNWYEAFFGRQPELKLKHTRALEQKRALANNNLAIINRHFDLFESTINEYGIEPDQYYNMDESGFSIGVAMGSKVVIRNTSQEFFKITLGQREWVSVIETISSSGKRYPPYIILKNKEHQQAVIDEAERLLPGSSVGVSENGWTNC